MNRTDVNARYCHLFLPNTIVHTVDCKNIGTDKVQGCVPWKPKEKR